MSLKQKYDDWCKSEEQQKFKFSEFVKENKIDVMHELYKQSCEIETIKANFNSVQEQCGILGARMFRI